MKRGHKLYHAYKMRWRRRRNLYSSIRSRHQLTLTRDLTGQIEPGDILLFSTVRNEALRLPYFLEHHRSLGVSHFLFVVNDSTDGTTDYLLGQPDVSVWTTQASYKASRFGVDWLGWLQRRYGHNHWCLTLDADEILVYPDYETRDLHALTAWLDEQNAPSFGAMMLDMYPKGHLGETEYSAGDDPMTCLQWFDAYNYTWELQDKHQNISIRGGVRKRSFFADTPELAPHLHKIPLIKWKREFTYVSSTHIALPMHLNHAFDARRDMPTGILLHTKFLNTIVEKSSEEISRQEHFTHGENYTEYYKSLIIDPILWDQNSVKFENWQTLLSCGLMHGGKWLN